jgi:hypothetical protein
LRLNGLPKYNDAVSKRNEKENASGSMGARRSTLNIMKQRRESKQKFKKMNSSRMGAIKVVVGHDFDPFVLR